MVIPLLSMAVLHGGKRKKEPMGNIKDLMSNITDEYKILLQVH